MAVKIRYLYAEGCRGWEKGLSELESALGELKINEKVEVIKITNISQAAKYDFIGSPTIRFGEAELGREAWETSLSGTKLNEVQPNLSCRVFLFKDKVHEYPPKEMIKDFITTYAVWKETDKGSGHEGVVLK